MLEKENIQSLIDEDELNFMLNQKFLDEFPNLNETMSKPQFTIGHFNYLPVMRIIGISKVFYLR